MSRRKQSKPRQIKRSVGDLDGGEENTADDVSLSGEEGGASDPDDSGEGDSSSPRAFTPLYNEEPRTHAAPPDDVEDEEEEEKARTRSTGEEEEEDGDQEDDSRLQWRGPDDLELREGGEAGTGVLARRDLAPHTRWGPHPGAVQPEDPEEDRVTVESSRFTLVCEEADCWLGRVPLTSDAGQANCTIYSRGEGLFCKLSREVFAGDSLLACLSPPAVAASLGQGSPPRRLITPSALVKKEEEEEEGAYPVALRSEIQLLPQQAGMAAILATAVVNKDIFPCKDCGIWYRSERNLQAHLMYYCASRMKAPAPASAATASPPPPQDKPKDSYPNERLCPFPQCNKSCPSASSLEIHMRTHSGERPFVCLVCLSAFTTKANCERHLKVHTDTLHGVCHGCGFVSATRDVLYSHLVTSHMVCQPGSHSEVYTPGPGLPKLPLSTGLSPGDSGVVLKCQVCGHNSDSPAQLQQHVRTHLEVRVPAERSPTPRQSTPPSAQLHPHPQPPPQDREPPGCVPRPDSSSPGANGGSATLPDHGPRPNPPAPGDLKIKEEPCSDSEAEEQRREAEPEGGEEEQGVEEEEEEKGAMKEKRRTESRDPTTTSSQTSPRSPSAANVKAEPTSPTPGSSPAHLAWSVLPGGTVFLPQNMFSPEAAILPQASEILAKMSEMVHSRLKQGQPVPPNTPAAFYPAGATSAGAAAPSPLHKGATCFECDITFNNINNFYVHKRLYCSSRHQNDPPASDPAAALGAPASVPAAGSHGATHSPQCGGAGSRAASASPTDSDPAAGSGATAEDRRPAEVKMETPGGREGVSSSSDGEGGGGAGGRGGGGRASESSQSPAESGSADDPEEDPSRTFCSACNIHFSRHENYTVHKRFYCASRHDPGNHRGSHAAKAAAATSAAFQPQPIRTRKRKKMYEIHMARSQALAQAAAAAAAAAPSPSTLGLAAKRDASPSQTARSSSPEGDGPIDLSKRPRLREAPRGAAAAPAGGSLPALPLTDYHKCTACSISFNSIENYLAHKTYYCPATTLQPHTLEQLHRLKRPASTSPKSRPQERADPHPHHHQSSEAKALPADWLPQLKGTSPSPHPSALPGSEAASPNPTTTLSPGGEAPQGSPPVLCPYCPPIRAVTCDLVEHFRSAHGLVLNLPQQREPQPGSQGASPGLSPRDGATPPASSTTPPKTGIRAHRNSLNGRVRRDTTSSSSSSPVVNGSPLSPVAAVSPLAVSPSRALSLTVSPVPEALREGVVVALLPDKTALALASHPLAAPPGPKASVVSPGQNGNTRFCRLCNIKFSSLSTFIAHKKYYCSSHSAEHIK